MFAPSLRQFVLAVLLAGCLAGPQAGCFVVRRPLSTWWVRLDKNTYRDLSLVVEKQTHKPYRPSQVERLRWMYGAEPAAVAWHGSSVTSPANAGTSVPRPLPVETAPVPLPELLKDPTPPVPEVLEPPTSEEPSPPLPSLPPVPEAVEPDIGNEVERLPEPPPLPLPLDIPPQPEDSEVPPDPKWEPVPRVIPEGAPTASMPSGEPSIQSVGKTTQPVLLLPPGLGSEVPPAPERPPIQTQPVRLLWTPDPGPNR